MSRALTALAGAATAVVLLAPNVTAASGVGRDTLLSHGDVSRWAYVLGPVAAHRAPSTDSPVVTVIKPETPEGLPNLVLALESRPDAQGLAWIRVRLAILPNNSTGWIREGSLGAFHVVRTHLIVERSRFRAVLWQSGRPVFRAQIGVGQGRWPTPGGEFYVREKLTDYGDAFYGPVSFGTSARSRVLTDWPGGGYMGIHGTDQPELIPGRISHGCIRMRNADILRLAQLLPLGTPVSVR